MENKPSQSSELVVVDNAPSVPAKDLAALRKHATDAINQHEKAVKSYWSLCVFIRDRQIDPITLNEELKKCGYSMPRISEIRRVSFCADEIFDQYRKGIVGFRFVLNEERAKKYAAESEQKELPIVALKSEEKLKHEMVDALSEIIPLKGPLPLLLRYRLPIQVNGYTVTITVKKTRVQKIKPEGKK